MMIPITFRPSTASYGINNRVRPLVTFTHNTNSDNDAEIGDKLPSTVNIKTFGTVFVKAHSSGGWVFDLNLTGDGECNSSVLEVTGGSFKYIEGFTGDDCNASFSITHDGKSSEIVVIYNTRPD